MKLNYDCIRDLLICLEERLQLQDNLPLSEIINDLEYQEADILYSTEKLIEAEYIVATLEFSDCCEIYICDYHSITFAGHDFLNSIRDASVWNKIKPEINIRSAPFEVIKSVGSGLLLSFLKSHLGI